MAQFIDVVTVAMAKISAAYARNEKDEVIRLYRDLAARCEDEARKLERKVTK